MTEDVRLGLNRVRHLSAGSRETGAAAAIRPCDAVAPRWEATDRWGPVVERAGDVADARPRAAVCGATAGRAERGAPARRGGAARATVRPSIRAGHGAAGPVARDARNGTAAFAVVAATASQAARADASLATSRTALAVARAVCTGWFAALPRRRTNQGAAATPRDARLSCDRTDAARTGRRAQASRRRTRASSRREAAARDRRASGRGPGGSRRRTARAAGGRARAACRGGGTTDPAIAGQAKATRAVVRAGAALRNAGTHAALTVPRAALGVTGATSARRRAAVPLARAHERWPASAVARTASTGCRY